ncbi:class E sortase [Streptomyces sp. CA-250714]|uniref:class E sortase n=1 Tax=Streptomyces sp. CA-250714 TaxID=3240060 RepID=UPI003D935AD6
MTTGHGDGTGGEGTSPATPEGGYGSEYDPYRAAVDALADPLNDPLPGQQPAQSQSQRQSPSPQQGVTPQPQQPGPVPADALYGAEADVRPAWYATAPHEAYDKPYEPYEAYAEPVPPQHQQPAQPVQTPQPQQFVPEPGPGRPQAPVSGHDPYAAALYQPGPDPDPPAGPAQTEDRSTVGLRRPRLEELSRRTGVAAPGTRSHTERPPGPSRLEARRAARALRPGPGIIASRAIGEVFITCGVLMLLFVAYQLWWTNVLADQQAGGAADKLHQQWDEHKPGDGMDPERKAGAFKPGEGFAIIHIPKIDISRPIAEGISKPKVLDKGMVGHYDEKPLKTAMPWDKKGNFALAGHRNTHGEPFRYINRLEPGDEVVVETQSKYYTYKVTRQLPSTSPSDTGVIDPVPPKSGYTKPGRYITLTTCTPEFTSKYRLIVWGKMVDERPRSKGKPDALVD